MYVIDQRTICIYVSTKQLSTSKSSISMLVISTVKGKRGHDRFPPVKKTRSRKFPFNFRYTYLTVAHYSDVIMSAMASQVNGVSIVHSTVCSGADQRKYQSSESLAFVREWPVDSFWWRHHGRVWYLSQWCQGSKTKIQVTAASLVRIEMVLWLPMARYQCGKMPSAATMLASKRPGLS